MPSLLKINIKLLVGIDLNWFLLTILPDYWIYLYFELIQNCGLLSSVPRPWEKIYMIIQALIWLLMNFILYLKVRIKYVFKFFEVFSSIKTACYFFLFNIKLNFVICSIVFDNFSSFWFLAHLLNMFSQLQMQKSLYSRDHCI